MNKINNYVFIAICSIVFILILIKAILIPVTHDETATVYHYIRYFSYWQIMMYPDSWPNNHILNTILVKFLTSIFGKDQIVVRLPNVLSFILYAVGIYRINKTVLKSNSVFFIPATLLFIFNPYLLDFFSLCRGYGMSCGLAVLSASYLITGFQHSKNKDIWFSLIFSMLAAYANFTLLVFWVSVTILIYLYFLIKEEFKFKLLIKPFMQVTIILILFLALIANPIYKMNSANQFVYWPSNGFINDTVLPLIDRTFYNSRIFNFINIKSFALLVYLTIAVNLIYILYKLKKEKYSISVLRQPFIIATMILLLTVFINILQCKILNTPSLICRTALFFFPLYILSLIGTIQLISKLKTQAIKISIALIITFLCSIHLIDRFNFKNVKDWDFDENTFTVLNYLNHVRNNKEVSLITHWLYYRSFQFYEYTGKTPWLKLLEANHQLDTATKAEYYYIFAEDYKTLEPKFNIAYKFTNDRWLVRNKNLLKK